MPSYGGWVVSIRQEGGGRDQIGAPPRAGSWSVKVSIGEYIAAPRWKKKQKLRDLLLDLWYLIVTTVEERRISSASLLLGNVRHHELVGNTPASWIANYGCPFIVVY
jgi:hypothetical protein